MTENRKIISLLIFSLQGGGAERVAKNLANGLVESGQRVHLVLVKKEGPYLTQLDKRVEVIHLEASRMRYVVLPLILYLRKYKPAALISFMTQINVVALIARILSRQKTRMIVTEHTTMSRFLGPKNAWFLRPTMMLYRLIYSWADVRVAVSKAAAEDSDAFLGLKKSRTLFVYNPVITKTLYKDLKESLPAKMERFFEIPVVITAGRLGEVKNTSMLIEAFIKARKKIPMRLLILGEGPLRKKLEKRIAEANIAEEVMMPGFLSNPHMYMRSAAVCVLSSNYEGLPSVLIEALACGVPVISTDCPGGSREILQDGKYGLLTPVGDADALAAAIVNVLENQEEAKRRTAAFQSEAMEQYTVEYATREYLKLLQLQ